MTYLDLLIRIKNGTQPKRVKNRVDDSVYSWKEKRGYVAEYDFSGVGKIHDFLTDVKLATEDIIEVIE